MTTADPKLVKQYREIPVKTLPHGKFSLNPGCEHVVVVVGGETEVSSLRNDF